MQPCKPKPGHYLHHASITSLHGLDHDPVFSSSISLVDVNLGLLFQNFFGSPLYIFCTFFFNFFLFQPCFPVLLLMRALHPMLWVLYFCSWSPGGLWYLHPCSGGCGSCHWLLFWVFFLHSSHNTSVTAVVFLGWPSLCMVSSTPVVFLLFQYILNCYVCVLPPIFPLFSDSKLFTFLS